MRTGAFLLTTVLLVSGHGMAMADIHKHGGSAEPLPARYVRVVSEADSPVQQTYIKSKDGAYVAAAIRKPKGDGPFPAIIMFHGAPGGRGMEQLVGWSRGDHGGPVWERFLQEGFVVVVGDYRGGDWNTMNVPSTGASATAIDDGLAVIEFVGKLPSSTRRRSVSTASASAATSCRSSPRRCRLSTRSSWGPRRRSGSSASRGPRLVRRGPVRHKADPASPARTSLRFAPRS